MENHMRSYKNRGKDIEDLRRRRNEVNVELRKNKREDNLLKKRNIDLNSESDVENENLDLQMALDHLPSLVMAAMNPNLDEKFKAIKMARMLLSSNNNPPIDKLIEAGILPALIDALRYSEASNLQFEAAWALTNIASGTAIQTRKVVDEGAVPLLIQLLESQNENVSEQALWALGNIIGDGPDLRDYVLENGILNRLLNILNQHSSPSFLRNLSWVIVNMTRNKDPPLRCDVLNTILPMLYTLLTVSQDTIVFIDVFWAISYITDHGNDRIQKVIDSDIVKIIIPYLEHEDIKIQTPALRVIGNIVTGTDEQTQFVLDLEVLKFFPMFLSHKKEKIIKEALWFLSNITAGRMDQIQTLIDHDLLPKVIKHLSEGVYQLQKEASWVISNMTLNGSQEQVEYLLNQDVIEPICRMLVAKDNQILQILLEALLRIFQFCPDKQQSIADTIEKCGGLDIIEALQEHENEQIYKLAFEIIDKYFESNSDLPELVPQANETSFGFNASNNPQSDQPFNF
ncbi:ankyrin repeat domain-containing protein 27-like [Sarcoptes scabiei]|nr:ankyrin repeat domain-containing protein 27-like [Sarcoptes scabiei]